MCNLKIPKIKLFVKPRDDLDPEHFLESIIRRSCGGQVDSSDNIAQREEKPIERTRQVRFENFKILIPFYRVRQIRFFL